MLPLLLRMLQHRWLKYALGLVWRHPDLTVLPMTRADDNEGEIVG